METLNRLPRRELRCSEDFLKWMGFLCLCLGTFSAAVLQRGLMHLNSQSTQSLYEALEPGGTMMGTASLAVSCTLASTLAIPMYAVLTAEGFVHTKHQRKYILRLALLALASELPFDLAMSGTLVDSTAQNPVFALCIALLALAILNQYGKPGAMGWTLSLLVTAAGCLWALLLGCRYGMLTVLLTAVFYLFRENKKMGIWLGAALSLLQFPAPFGVLFVHWYDGTPGKTNRWLFYALYPAHLLLFAAASALV